MKPLNQALEDLERAAAVVADAAGEATKGTTSEQIATVLDIKLKGALGDFARAGGELTVSAVSEFRRAAEARLEAAKIEDASARRFQNILIVAGSVFALLTAGATAVQAYAAFKGLELQRYQLQAQRDQARSAPAR